MPRTTDRSHTPCKPLLWGLALLMCATFALAQEIQVDTATPDMAEQGTYDLEVVIGGDNFPSDAEVDFFITGTEDPGGITVLGKPKRQGPKTLKVKIDVAEDAQTQLKFDVRVRSKRGGRSGKGTELFNVTQKQHPTQDETPPGEPTDLTDPPIEIGYGTVKVSYTVPADDGYDPLSGPVEFCGGMYTYWCDSNDYWLPLQPGRTETCIYGWLEPDTTYSLGAFCQDEANNRSTEAQVLATTRPYSEFQDPSWSTVPVPVAIGDLIGHGIDGNGDVVIAGSLTLGVGKGKKGQVETAIRLVTGRWDEPSSSWTWSYEDIDGFANRMLIDPVSGDPTFVGMKPLERTNFDNPRVGFNRALDYTFHDGTGWVTETVEAQAGPYAGIPGFAFDADGNPAIAWCLLSDASNGIRLARRAAAGVWTVEQASSSVCDITDTGGGGRSAELVFDGQGDPAIFYVEIISWWEPIYRQWLLRKSPSGWTQEEVLDPQPMPHSFLNGTLVYDHWRGDFSMVGPAINTTDVCDRSGASSWSCKVGLIGMVNDTPTFDYQRKTFLGTSWVGQDDRGELFVAYETAAGEDVAVATRAPGEVDWSDQYVDHPLLHGYDAADVELLGPFLAFDQLDQPTLSWAWNGDLYFAWKETP